MAALAAASLVASEGIEPILHVTTRDRNRIALVSEALGAQALGIRNVLCTSGTHQTLGRFRAAKNVYDIDSVQLVQAYAQLAVDGSLVSERGIPGAGPFCLGAVASPDADPLALQVSRALKKVNAGAAFLITQPIYDLQRFHVWWEAITQRGIHERVAILAGIQPLPEEELTKARGGQRSLANVPQSTLHRVGSAESLAGRRAAATEVALETIEQLSAVQGLRGFGVCGDGDCDAALEIIERSGLGRN
jgi:methylenetetrahydrofolate reductase (NADPH)